MKILGHTKLKPRTVDVFVGESEDGTRLVLSMRAPGLNFLEEIDSELPAPRPPVIKGQVERDGRGRPVKDAQGRSKPLRDEEDPDYVRAVELRERALSIAMILNCLGDQVEPKTKREDHADPVSFYLAVWSEFEEFGFTVSTFHSLSNAAQTLAGPMTEDELAGAKRALGVDAESQEGVEPGKS